MEVQWGAEGEGIYNKKIVKLMLLAFLPIKLVGGILWVMSEKKTYKIRNNVLFGFIPNDVGFTFDINYGYCGHMNLSFKNGFVFD